MPVLVVTPLRREYDVLVQALRAAGHPGETARVGRLNVVRFPTLGATIAISGHGKAQSAIQTQHLVDRRGSIDVVVCAGVAGALRSDLKIGDVVVGTDTIEHDFRTRFNPRPSPVFTADASLVEELRGIGESNALPFGVHFGSVASGDEDVIDGERAREIAGATGAACVAWEGAGVARVCAFNGLGFVEVRGVTDGADAGAPGDFRRHLDVAVANVGALIGTWLSRTAAAGREPS